jgi:TfoX/Sxy family transcriptional regulator of competence genes
VPSDETFVAFIRDQMAGAGSISARKMFGEFAIYCGGTVVALVCDNQLFVKPTVAGKALLRDPSLAPPYPGAKPYFLMDNLDDGESLSAIIAATARELALLKAKTPRKKTKKAMRQGSNSCLDPGRRAPNRPGASAELARLVGRQRRRPLA